MSEHDMETGELPFRANGISDRATAAVASNRIALDREKKGVGQKGIQHALEQATRRLPVWITTDANGNRGKYATLKAILAIVKPVLAEHGIRIRQGSDMSRTADDGTSKGRLVPVYTDLVHAISGDVERTVVEMPLTRLDPQSMGSAITYGKRYSLLAALGLATDEADDDGARAMPHDIAAKVSDGAELVALKIEIDEIAKNEKTKPADKLAALTKWATDPKVKRRMNDLPEGEVERLRMHFVEAREAVA